ncbi:MAG TPA: sulfate ABC transporter permease subunit CysT [Solirubrobacteraceae bacterium]
MSPQPSSVGAGVGTDIAAGASQAPAARRVPLAKPDWSTIAAGGTVVAWLSLIVLVPIAAVVAKALGGGLDAFWSSVTNAQAIAALKLTVSVSAVVAIIDAVMGTLIAWVLVRDEFRGKKIVNALIDLPFALPTIVAGLTLLALYGPKGPVGINVAYTQAAIGLALLFVTMPFVVRAVQPVLMALDREVEEAAESLGASPLTTFRRVVLPTLRPAILAGVGLAFGRAVGEFGSIVLISGNLPYKTEVASVFVFGQIESGNVEGAAAVSVLLLVVSFVVLLAIAAFARTKGEA